MNLLFRCNTYINISFRDWFIVQWNKKIKYTWLRLQSPLHIFSWKLNQNNTKDKNLLMRKILCPVGFSASQSRQLRGSHGMAGGVCNTFSSKTLLSVSSIFASVLELESEVAIAQTGCFNVLFKAAFINCCFQSFPCYGTWGHFRFFDLIQIYHRPVLWRHFAFLAFLKKWQLDLKF